MNLQKISLAENNITKLPDWLFLWVIINIPSFGKFFDFCHLVWRLISQNTKTRIQRTLLMKKALRDCRRLTHIDLSHNKLRRSFFSKLVLSCLQTLLQHFRQLFCFRWPKNQGELWFENVRFINLSHNNFDYVSQALENGADGLNFCGKQKLTIIIWGASCVLEFHRAGGIGPEPQPSGFTTRDELPLPRLLEVKAEKGSNCEFLSYWLSFNFFTVLVSLERNSASRDHRTWYVLF